MADRRPERVAHLVQAELARVLLRDVRDPRLHDVAITAVRMTADLRLARVYFRTFAGASTAADAGAALARATPFLRGAVGRAIGMRVTPELRFEFDGLPDTARRLDELLSTTAAEEPEKGGSK
jgi:ribosome-binding factor A